MGLEVGDWVEVVVCSLWFGRVARIAEFQHGVVMLCFDTVGPTFWVPRELQRVCSDCHHARAAHTKEGRCFFGASSWR